MDKITEDSSEKFKIEVDRIKKEIANLRVQPINLKPDEKSFEYYKGFYYAVHCLMQTFEKLIDSGVLNGTKSNTNN